MYSMAVGRCIHFVAIKLKARLMKRGGSGNLGFTADGARCISRARKAVWLRLTHAFHVLVSLETWQQWKARFLHLLTLRGVEPRAGHTLAQ